MKDLKFIELLKTLSKKEMRQFVAYAQFEIKKEKEKAALAFIIERLLKKYLPDKKEVLRLLAYDSDKHLGKVLNKYMVILEHFIAAMELRQFPDLQYHLLMQRLKAPEQEKLFVHVLQKAERSLQKQRHNSPQNLQFFLVLSHGVFFHPLVDALPGKRYQLNQIEHLMGVLDDMFALSKLQYTSILLSENQILHQGVSVDLLNEVKTLKRVQGNQLFALYAKLVDLFLSYCPHKFQAFKFLVFKTSPLVSKLEQEALFRQLINLVAHAIRRDKKHLKDALEIYEFGIDNKLLLVDGFLDKEHLINYINIACVLGKYDKAQLVLDKYQDKLHISHKEQVVHLCKSSLLLAQKQYKEAFAQLYNTNFINTELRLLGRSNRVMACFDWYVNGKEEMLLNGLEIFIKDEMESYRNCLRGMKKKLGKDNERIKANEQFRLFVLELLSHMNTLDEQLKLTLRQKLDATELIICRKWLETKVDQLSM